MRHLPVLATDNTEFSYTCNACSRCCYDKRIMVNPYEVLRLARNRGISTTELIQKFTDSGGTALKTQANGACIFLGEKGCAVHADRPLVCRLYPLGRIVEGDGSVRYIEFEPHPETEGVYGTGGTIAQFVESQGVAPYVAASDRYYVLLTKLAVLLDSLDSNSTIASEDFTSLEEESARFVDVDATVKAECDRKGDLFSNDVESLIDRHLQLLEGWANSLLHSADR